MGSGKSAGVSPPPPQDDINIEDEDHSESESEFQLDKEAIMSYCFFSEEELLNYYILSFGCDDTPTKARIPYHTSEETGLKWVRDILSCPHPDRCYNNFSMNRDTFLRLCRDLTTTYGWVTQRQSDNMVTVIEALAMFICMLRGMSMQQIDERFNRGKGTVSKNVTKILECLDTMGKDVLAPLEGHQNRQHPYLGKRSFYQYFKDCIGAIDGTHVYTQPPKQDKMKFFSRKGGYTMNIIAACDFDLCFIYASTGWEGIMHDYSVFKKTIYGKNRKRFPHPNPGKYYLVDAGYANREGYLAPYKGSKYHLEDFRRGNRRIKDSYELFNRWHSSLRCCVERAFGVWKARWRMMKNAPTFPVDKHSVIVLASMTIHNYIRRHDKNDPYFRKADTEDLNYVYQNDADVAGSSTDPDDTFGGPEDADNDAVMHSFREDLRRLLLEHQEREQQRERGNQMS